MGTKVHDRTSFSFLLVMGILIAASAMAAFVADRKHVMESCNDLRIAMDGGYSAVVESGGLNPSTQITIYQEHNRKRIRIDKVPVDFQPNGEGQSTYVGEKLKLVVHNKKQSSTGRQLASLQGEVKGEKVSATLSCGR
jgi:hypothetical protein